jgi:signal transduction histidine kinase
MLNTANLAYELLKRGTVAINGSTGAVLGRTLINLGDFVESILSEIRLSAQLQRRERLSVASFVDEIAVSAQLHADNRGLEFIIESGDSARAVTADRQMLVSAVMNLLNNAFKYTRAGGRVILRVHAADTRLGNRGGRRVRGLSSAQHGRVPAIRSAARKRSHGAGPRTLDCP